jgi:hypothetical protein
LYDGCLVALDRTGPDPQHAADVRWVRKRDLPRINGFELKSQGACRADLCIPIPNDLLRGEYVNLTAFAKKAGRSVVAKSEYLLSDEAFAHVSRRGWNNDRQA